MIREFNDFDFDAVMAAQEDGLRRFGLTHGNSTLTLWTHIGPTSPDEPYVTGMRIVPPGPLFELALIGGCITLYPFQFDHKLFEQMRVCSTVKIGCFTEEAVPGGEYIWRTEQAVGFGVPMPLDPMQPISAEFECDEPVWVPFQLHLTFSFKRA